MASVYIETSIISHASSRASADPVVCVLQSQARQWWDDERHLFDLYTSQLVIDEVSAGDPLAAADRLKMLVDVPLVDINEEVRRLSGELLGKSLMPMTAAADALHVAAAAAAGIDYLLTLNCRHIANAFLLPRVYNALRDMGVDPPLICTPAEFLQDSNDD